MIIKTKMYAKDENEKIS